ncbi:MAG: ABC transporter ATP-binding protein [Proteobacteria bacterium]|nr:ABC transporter ATP-binding protein [Pseudomonadota bacterium]
MSQPIFEMHGVSKRYGVGVTRVEALDNIDLDADAGGVMVVVGPSGSGKSTLLHLVGGMDRPDAGELFVAGEALHTLNTAALTLFRRHKIGFVFQAYNLMPNLTALENVMLPAEFLGLSSKEARRRAWVLLERVALTARPEHRPGQLSGGEQQRVAIARALVNRPALVIADEPTGNLDSKTGAAIIELLTSLTGEQSVIIATHDERIATAADRVIHLVDGRIERDEAGGRPR